MTSPDATIPAELGWRDRIESMDHSFRWAGIMGVQLIVAMVSCDEEKAVRLAKVAGGLAIEGLEQSSYGWYL